MNPAKATSQNSSVSAFARYHPVVPFVCLCCVLVLTMAAMQPACIGLSGAAAFLCSMSLRGWRDTIHTLSWQLPLVLIIALINPLFSLSGSTELFRIDFLGQHPVYWESFVYGLCMGGMLVSVLLWFSNAAHMVTSDEVISLFGNVLPVVSLLVSMTMRLVPQFKERATEIGRVRAACRISQPTTFQQRVASRARTMSVLMGWSMEDSLERADSMRSRGWGVKRHRTQYVRRRFRARDGVMLAFLVALFALDAWVAWAACSVFMFYPALSPLTLWWGYAPYAVLMFFPLLMQGGEWLWWHFLEGGMRHGCN